MLPDFDACVDLLAAIGRRWVLDARRNYAELIGLARWLDLEPDELRQRLNGRSVYYVLPAAGCGRACPGCGRALPAHNASHHGAGRKRIYCSERCRHKVKAARLCE